jgi:hypothetical protein
MSVVPRIEISSNAPDEYPVVLLDHAAAVACSDKPGVNSLPGNVFIPRDGTNREAGEHLTPSPPF